MSDPVARDGWPVLLYDGDCGFCSRAVTFVLAHERRPGLLFAPRRGTFGQAVTRRHPQLATANSLAWLDRGPAGERLLLRSEAVLRVARHVGGVAAVAGLARLVPRAWRDAAYRLVAAHRHLLGSAACAAPPADRLLP